MSPVAEEERWSGLAAARPYLLPVELIVFGLLGAVAPYLSNAVGLAVDTKPVVEVVDHVIPGAVVVAVAVATLVGAPRSFIGSMLVLAAGLWMTASHLPLLVQATRGEAGLGAALVHSVPGMVILALAVVMVIIDRPRDGPRADGLGLGASTGDTGRPD